MNTYNFDNIMSEVAITSMREVTCTNLLYFTSHHQTRQLMIFIMRPFINVLRDNDFNYFLNMIQELDDNENMINNIREVISTVVDRSVNHTNMRLVIDLITQRCNDVIM